MHVEDDGPGIHPSEANRVFDRFFRGKAGSGVPGGTGLGLTIVHDLATRWNGSVELEATGRGNTHRRTVPGAGRGDGAYRALTLRWPAPHPPPPILRPMRHRLAIVLTVIGAIALPVVMAATVLYASDAAIGDPAEPLTPQFKTTGPGTTTGTGTTDDNSPGGQTGGTTTGADDHGGSTPAASGSSGGGSDDGSGGGGSTSGGSGSSHGGGDDGGSSGGGGGSGSSGGTAAATTDRRLPKACEHRSLP